MYLLTTSVSSSFVEGINSATFGDENTAVKVYFQNKLSVAFPNFSLFISIANVFFFLCFITLI